MEHPECLRGRRYFWDGHYLTTEFRGGNGDEDQEDDWGLTDDLFVERFIKFDD